MRLFHLFRLISRCAALAALAGPAAAAPVRADGVDAVVLAEMRRQHIPGLSIAVVRDGKLIKAKGYGLANVEHGVAVTPETVFQSGSVGKQFTAALVMLLAEDGKLALDSPISAYLSDTPPGWAAITVRHLLTHTSGMAEDVDGLDLHRDFDDAQLQALIAAVPLQAAPGQQWAYSNIGYQLLGLICNRVGGAFYGDQLRERIFQPAGMGAATISERDIVPHRAAGYDLVDGQLKNQDWVSPSLNRTADGSLYLTATDLARWDIALYGERPLSGAIKDASWTPVTLNDGSRHPYGFGWELAPRRGHRLIGHDGAWQGFITRISRFVDDRLTVVVLSNLSTTDVDVIVNRIAGQYVPALAPVARAVK